MENKEKWLAGVAFLLLVVALFLNLGIFPLYNEEPRRALIALEMLYNNNFIVPTELGEYYYKKPPFYNWLVIGSFKLFGEGSEWALRVISVVSLLLMGALTFWIVRKYANVRLAVYSAFFFVISADIFFFFSMSGEIDIFYSLVTFASLVCAFHFYTKQQHLLLFISVCALNAIGFLTKGLPSLVFSIITLLTLFFYHKKFWRLVSWEHVTGILLFCSITGAYFYAYSAYNNPISYFNDLWTQSSNRTVIHTGITPLLLHIIKFPFVVIKDTLPVSLFLPLIFRKGALRSILQSELLKFCLYIFLANIAVYWISPGTRSRYHYMLYPLFVILCTHLLLEFGSARLLQKGLQYFIALAVLLIFVAGCALPFVELPFHLQNIPLLAAATVSIAVVFGAAFFYFKTPVQMWLILLVIGLRMLFDLYVLPVRAREGEHVQFKRDAEKIAEITKGKNLYLYNFYGDGTYSLGNAFYLERERRQVLSVNPTRNCDDYFIAYAHEPAPPWTIHYEYSWRTFRFYLVQFTDCDTNG